MSRIGPDAQRARFRRPIGVAIMAYKAVLGLSEIIVGVLLGHRGVVAVGLIMLGLAKLVAAAAMWEGQEWGGYLLATTVAPLLPFDVRQAIASPTPGHVLLATANAAVLAVLVLLRGRLPAWPT